MGNRREKVARASGALWKLMDGADGSDMDDEEVWLAGNIDHCNCLGGGVHGSRAYYLFGDRIADVWLVE